MEYFKETHYHHCYFCISLYVFSLKEQLNELNIGYEEHTTKTKVSHIPYVDDLTLIGKTEEELQKQMQVVRNFSDYIHMEFGPDKCAKICMYICTYVCMYVCVRMYICM
jgi:hypothetical protein